MTDETRNWTQLADDNIYLKEQLTKLRETNAALQQANHVASQIDNVQLHTAADRTRVYSPTPLIGSIADIFTFAFTAGAHWQRFADDDSTLDSSITATIEEWKAQRASGLPQLTSEQAAVMKARPHVDSPMYNKRYSIICKLIEMSLVYIYEGGIFRHVEITDTGRAALTQYKAQQK